ncbi:MAG: aspartate aminotransferase family protein [Gemmobacter sp.]
MTDADLGADPEADLIARRARLMGPNVPTFYRAPVEIVRGEGVWLWDASGRRYLDCYNNVAHVGHCHPHVVAAIARQAGLLATHTRYLHRGVLDYLERLMATFGHGIAQGIMVCTGSEANDVALRMAQAATGRRGIIATDATYHGNTTAVHALSARRTPVGGHPDHIRFVPAPDGLAPAGGSAAAEAQRLGAAVAAAAAALEAAGHGVAALLLCSVFANEGLPAVPRGHLDAAVAAVRGAGGLVIADEVQPGFGRTGSHFWAHDRLGLAPDIVTLGKPMGNGYPVAAVLARPGPMAAFRERTGYFNTFGGNPVAAAAAAAVLDVIEAEGLMAHAARGGAETLARLQALRHPWLRQVRAEGLFFALEFRDEAGAPAGEFVARLVEAMVARGVLLNRVGAGGQILKIRPPMPFGSEHAEILARALAEALAATPTRP